MGKTSTASKQKYNDKAYDIVKFHVPKGEKQVIMDRAARQGKSLATYIKDLIKEDIDGEDTDKKST